MLLYASFPLHPPTHTQTHFLKKSCNVAWSNLWLYLSMTLTCTRHVTFATKFCSVIRGQFISKWVIISHCLFLWPVWQSRKVCFFYTFVKKWNRKIRRPHKCTCTRTVYQTQWWCVDDLGWSTICQRRWKSNVKSSSSQLWFFKTGSSDSKIYFWVIEDLQENGWNRSEWIHVKMTRQSSHLNQTEEL